MKTTWLALIGIALACTATAASQDPPGRSGQQTPPIRRDPTRQLDPQQDPQTQRPPRAHQAGLLPDDVQFIHNVVFATVPAANENEPQHELLFDAAFLKQSNGQPMPAVVYFHGGGFMTGTKDEGTPYLAALARGGYFAVSVGYRLADEARFPAAVHDGKAAIRFLRAHADELGIDPNRIGVMGHGDGGHLAALIGLTTSEDSFDGNIGVTGIDSSVTCIVSISGAADLTLEPDGGKRLQRWLGGSGEVFNQRLINASPISHVDVSDPPVLLVHGAKNQEIPILHAERMIARLGAAGVTAELVRVGEQGRVISDPEVYRRIGEFLDAHLGGNATEHLRIALDLDQGRAAPPHTAPLPDTPPGSGAGQRDPGRAGGG